MKKKLLILAIFVSCFFVFAETTVYKSNATASFYGKDFHGKLTSNGELFDMKDYTCAHKSLPFDTVLKITNLSNGKTVNVRVNDRGPFVSGREIDLSTAAAEKLDMINAGTTKVKIEIVKLGPKTKQSQQTAEKAKQMMEKIEGTAKTTSEKAKTQEKKKTDTPTTGNKSKAQPAGTLWDFQIGAYRTKENARNRAKELAHAGFENIIIQKSGEIFRVAIKEVDGRDIPEMEKKLKEKGFTEYIIKQRKTKSQDAK